MSVEHFAILTTDQCETDRFGCALVFIVLATAEMTYLLFVEWDSKLCSLTTVKVVGVNKWVALKVGDRLLRCIGGTVRNICCWGIQSTAHLMNKICRK